MTELKQQNSQYKQKHGTWICKLSTNPKHKTKKLEKSNKIKNNTSTGEKAISNCYPGMSAQYGTLPRMVVRLSELPRELFDAIERDVEQTMGHEFFLTPMSSLSFQDYTHHLESEQEVVSVIGHLLGLEGGVSEVLDNDFVEKMGSGYCYLKCIRPESRLRALKQLYAWPNLQSVLIFFEEELISDFYLTYSNLNDNENLLHMSPNFGDMLSHGLLSFHSQCNQCHAVGVSDHWSKDPVLNHRRICTRTRGSVTCTPVYDNLLDLRVGGFFDKFRTVSSSGSRARHSRSKSLTDSSMHEDKQVLKFSKSIKGDGIEPDMSRDLYSVPKPTEVETMADHLNNHKSGDIFPYVSVVGNEEETKDGRLSRLRAFRSSYGKENRPEMRINGVILDEIEGTIKVSHIGEYVNKERLSKQQRSENKKFKPLSEASFKKPYLQIARITGEYVPLMSSTSDYTELYFTLEDGRLLDNQTIVQSNKLPTNQNGVFELSCDYCINLKDIEQLSLKYFLSRPIMKENFQWGAVSLTIRLSEADTPYLTPKVEAMAIARIPFTTLEDQSKDPDHADVVYTAKQVEKFKELYRAGDVMDIDEAKREKTKLNSYSKSTIRGAIKGEAGPSHLSQQEGWGHLKGMVKPRIEEGVASVSAMSDPDEIDIDVPSTTRQEYERQQEILRAQFQSPMSDTTEEIPRSDMHRSSSSMSESNFPNIGEVTPPRSALKSALKKPRFEDSVLQPPNTNDVYKFD